VSISDSEETVKKFLSALEDRNLEMAMSFLSTKFIMIFPGGIEMRTIDELLEWSKKRYSFVKKTYDTIDCLESENQNIIYCMGSLNGERNDGTPIRNVRFIDRFMIIDGKIEKLFVWNDLAESMTGGF